MHVASVNLFESYVSCPIQVRARRISRQTSIVVSKDPSDRSRPREATSRKAVQLR